MRSAILIVVTLALTGCATGAPAATPTPAVTVTAAPPVVEEDDMAACAIVTETLTPTLDIVTKMIDDPTGASVTAPVVSALAAQLRELLDLASSRMDAYAAPYASTVLLLDDIFEGKVSGSQTVDTGAYRDSILPLLTYCTDVVGYKAP